LIERQNEDGKITTDFSSKIVEIDYSVSSVEGKLLYPEMKKSY